MEDKEDAPKAFTELSTYPAFKKHKFLDNKEKALELFFKGMSEHIKDNLNYPEKAMEENIQGKTNVYFLISKEGTINEIYAFNSHPLLQLEGIRIIELLPKIIPGSIDGKNINVTYAQPMTFKMQ
jgi:protein TonB